MLFRFPVLVSALRWADVKSRCDVRPFQPGGGVAVDDPTREHIRSRCRGHHHLQPDHTVTATAATRQPVSARRAVREPHHVPRVVSNSFAWLPLGAPAALCGVGEGATTPPSQYPGEPASPEHACDSPAARLPVEMSQAVRTMPCAATTTSSPSAASTAASTCPPRPGTAPIVRRASLVPATRSPLGFVVRDLQVDFPWKALGDIVVRLDPVRDRLPRR